MGRRDPLYLLALEVTNLRLAVELARSAMRLSRWGDALEHLESVEAPGRRLGRGNGDDGDTHRLSGSIGPAAGDPRYTRPSLLVRIVEERVAARRVEEEARERLIDERQQRAELAQGRRAG